MEYRYTSTEERVYPDLGVTVNQNDVVDWPDVAPADGHWEPTDETRVELEHRAAEEAARAAAEQPSPTPAPGTGDTPPTGGESSSSDGGEPPTETPTTTAPRASGRKTTKE